MSDIERALKMTNEELRTYLNSLTFLERLDFTVRCAEFLAVKVGEAFPKAHAVQLEGELRSDKQSHEAAQSEIERIRRM